MQRLWADCRQLFYPTMSEWLREGATLLDQRIHRRGASQAPGESDIREYRGETGMFLTLTAICVVGLCLLIVISDQTYKRPT